MLAALVTLCAVLSAAAPASIANEATQYSCEEWDASLGYPGGRIYGITQTRDGYLWIGTDRGLVRFDGAAFHLFRETSPARNPIDSVYALAGDAEGNLLISTATLQRLRLRNEKLEELPPLPGQPDDTVSAIYREANGAILIARVRRGLVTFNGKTFTPIEGTRSDITSAVRARDNTIWMGTATLGLSAYPARQFPEKPPRFDHVKIGALGHFKQHGISIGTDKGLLQWDGLSPTVRATGPPRIQVMLQDRRGALWLGAHSGLHYMATEDAAPAPAPCVRHTVTSLFEDREGNIWAGSSTGIARIRKRILTTYVLNGNPDSTGGSLFVDPQGAVWCARPNLGLVRIANGRPEQVLATAGFTSLAGAGSDLWLGLKNGAIWRANLPLSSASRTPFEEVQGKDPVLSLFKSAAGSLWIGEQNAGVSELANGQVHSYAKAGELALTTVAAIEQTPDGSLWFATANGLASLSQGQWRTFTARDGLPPGRINCLLADGSSILWVGAERGLAYIKTSNEKGKPPVAAINPPLLQEPIFGVAADRDDFLWILTASRVLRIHRNSLLHGETRPAIIRQFGLQDGLPAVAPSRTGRSIVADSAGRIWISLGNTVTMADPAELRPLASPTLVQLQQVSADEVALPMEGTVKVPAGHLRTILRFTGLNLTAPDRVRFRYKLSSFDNDWSEPTSIRQATFTNLAPGPYRFEVQASNIDGVWNGPTASVDVYLEPALPQTLWFRTTAVLLVCLAAFAIYRWRLGSIRRQWNVRFEERLEERTRIARDLHDTLLQSFQGLILRFQAAQDMLPAKPEAATQALTRAIEQAASAIEEGRDAVQSLRGEEDDDNLVESLAAIDREFRANGPDSERNQTKASYRVLVEGTPRRLHPLVRDDLYRIAREAVRNAYNHAQAKQIELDILYDESALRLRVRDDGAGIDPQVLRSGRRKGHYGLPGMRERATSIGGQFEMWSELRRGTEIEVTVPALIAYVQFEDSRTADLY